MFPHGERGHWGGGRRCTAGDKLQQGGLGGRKGFQPLHFLLPHNTITQSILKLGLILLQQYSPTRANHQHRPLQLALAQDLAQILHRLRDGKGLYRNRTA